MGFDPSGFFKFATILYEGEYNELGRLNNVKEKDEDLQNLKQALFRTIISRLYYYVFLTLRERIKRQIKEHDYYTYLFLESFMEDPIIHGFISEILFEISSEYGKWINSLRKLRNSSDYIIKKTIKEKDIKKAMFLARQLTNELDIIANNLKQMLKEEEENKASSRIERIVVKYYDIHIKKSKKKQRREAINIKQDQIQREHHRYYSEYDDSRTYW